MTPAATAWSCDAVHLCRPLGSGVGEDLTVAVGVAAAVAAGRVALGAGGGVVLMLKGVPQDISVTTRSQRSIGGR
jgi:hypothetical protein